jgi:hypothetical protein
LPKRLTTAQEMHLRRIRKERLALARTIAELQAKKSQLPTARKMARELGVSYKCVMAAIHG